MRVGVQVGRGVYVGRNVAVGLGAAVGAAVWISIRWLVGVSVGVGTGVSSCPHASSRLANTIGRQARAIHLSAGAALTGIILT